MWGIDVTHSDVFPVEIVLASFPGNPRPQFDWRLEGTDICGGTFVGVTSGGW
jgi:hypothetical protein